MNERRLRSTAFALLARREHSQKEMAEKLISYGACPEKVAELLSEFSEKGYQSDSRMSGVLLRHSVNKGQGINRIKQALKKHDMSTEFIADELEQINWLAEAIKARKKRFGETLPTEAKAKAKQLRFLQYRGFAMNICYTAIKTNDEFYE